MKRIVPVLIALIIPFVAYSQEIADTTASAISVEEQAVEEKASADGRADDGSILKYRRSSLFSVIIEHPTFPYGEAIDSAFFAMPMPDKFNDHNLGVRAIVSNADKMKKGGKKKDETNEADIRNFIQENHIAREMVAKWFNRDPYTGAFDMELIQERGFYDASQADINAATLSTRSIAALGDAGEDLIGKTFMIVNDITFVDKGENSQKAAVAFSIIGRLAAAVTGSDALADVGDAVAAGVNEIDGFTVNITTYLYRLVWTDDCAGMMYTQYWINPGSSDPERKAAFENSDIFRLQYVGKATSTAQNTSSKSFSKYSKSQQMLRTCARAVDHSIVSLQREFDEFKVNVPITKVNEDGTVEVAIGLKEGVTEHSRYEVLMAIQANDGHVRYQHIGTLAPVKGKIWDNRFGALDEALDAQAQGKTIDDASEDGASGNALLTGTTFKVTEKTGKIMPGVLVREKKIK